jgi:hypothetical protein
MRAAVAAIALSLVVTRPAAAGERPPPPPPPADSHPVVPFEHAFFVFDNPDFPAPLKVTIRLEPYDRNAKTRLRDMDLSLGEDTIRIGHEMLADIPSPNLLRLEATAFKNSQGRKIVAIILMQREDCPPEGCGLVELDWTVGEGVRKLDARK